jgi:hypothetical protein
MRVAIWVSCIFASVGKCEKKKEGDTKYATQKKETDQNPTPQEMQTRNACSRCREKHKTASIDTNARWYYNMCSDKMIAVAVTVVIIANDGDCLWPWSMVHVYP